VLLLGIGKTAEASIKQVFEFSDSTFIENIHVRPNGHLLISTFGTAGELLSLVPTAADPSPRSVANLTGSTGLSGIATIGPSRYAVSGGIHSSFKFANNSMHVYVLSVPENSDKGVVLDRISVPDTEMLNGMAALPAMPYVVLSADSISGRIFRINTRTRLVDVAFSDPNLGPGGNIAVPLGANGLKIHNGFLYFTNSGQGTFARVQINNDGSKAGEVQVITKLQGAVSMSNAYDDFAFDREGNAYVALHSFSVRKISANGVQTNLAGGGNNTFFKEPTSVALSRDGKSIYVSTGGTTLDGVVFGGQIIQVSL